MMKKLSKEQIEELNEFIEDLRKQETDVNAPIARAIGL
jgi:hypothetical protein